MQVVAPMTFWSQSNPYTKYIRCDLPAKVLNCPVRDADAVRWIGYEHAEMNEGVAIWQILCNAARLNMVRKMMSAGIPCYGEIDDDYTRWDESVANADWTAGMPEHINQASVELHRRAITLLDGVICATSRLAEIYSTLNPNVHVCRNAVDLDDWLPIEDKDDVFTIVWMASGSHKIDQKLVLPALNWAAEQKGVEVYLFGPIIPGATKISRIPWISNAQEYRDKLVALKPDLGLCVIRDTMFTRGKSDLKALEYSMAGALPIVSPLESYKDWWIDNTYTARSTDEWLSIVQWAVKHKDEVRNLAKRCYNHTVTERTIQKEAPAWLDAVGVPMRELEGVK